MFYFNDGNTLGNAPFFVAEFNTSHFGDEQIAKEMINISREIGVNCVKFQSWSTHTLYSKTYYESNPIAKRFVRKYSFDEATLSRLASYCVESSIGFMSTPYSMNEVNFLLNKCKVPAIKMASMEINNLEFIKDVALTGSAIILSTGMADLAEITEAVEQVIKTGNDNLCLLHCVSQYPTELKSCNINNIKMLKNTFPEIEIGYSDHTLSHFAAEAAVSIGASLIEKHFTLDKTKIGMDNQMASEPSEFKEMIKNCLNIHECLGKYERVVSKEEKKQQQNMRRSLVYKKDFSAGKILGKNDIIFKRPGTGLPPNSVANIIGKKLLKDVDGDTLLMFDDLK